MFNPSILTFAVNDIPLLCSTILSWLRPPYLYVIINIIMITIIATSRFPPVTIPPMIVYEDVNMLSKMCTVLYVVENPIIYDEPVVVDDKEVLVVNEAEDIHEVTRSTWQSPVEKVQTEFVFQ
nr:leucine zipper protein [Tanacetum cinerariifolium]